MVNSTDDVFIDVEVSSIDNWEIFIPTSIDISQTTSTGIYIILSEVEVSDPTISGSDIAVYSRLVDSGSITSTESNLVVDKEYGQEKIYNSYILSNVDCDTGNLNTLDTINKCLLGSKDYLNYSNIINKFSVSSTLDSYPTNIVNDVKLYIGTVGNYTELEVDLFLSQDKYYYDIFDIYSCLVNFSNNISNDITTVSGRVHNYKNDIYNCVSGTLNYKYDIYNSYLNYLTYKYDIVTVSGLVEYQLSDCYSCIKTISSGIKSDIRIRSLYIESFSIYEDTFTNASTTIHVDLLDYLYSIDISKSYFKIDGESVSVTFSGIDNGYRMYYNPTNDFYTKDTLVVTAHATNTVGDIYELDYYLLFGYDVAYTHKGYWSPNENILVRMQASNLSDCVNIGADSYYFITQDLPSYELSSSIRCVEAEDLLCEIYPQSTTFFYGSSFIIRVEGVKDFDGNEMDNFIFNFNIENPNN